METLEKQINQWVLMPIQELIDQANAVRKAHIGSELQLCSILNAKSGLCSEDCKFCAQSARHHASVDVYDLKSADSMVQAATEAAKIGARRFGIVTSGNRLTPAEVETIAQAARRIVSELDLGVCGSLGALDQDQLIQLKQAGMSRYHHNIETSRRFYPHIVSTHDYDERLNTVRSARAAGLQTCSGGIIGLGEDWADRVDMALTLKDLDVDSVPINILTPIPGTPLESITRISAEDVIRTVCLFRLILKDKIIKLAAGRESVLGSDQIKGFEAGANGMIIGGYLTVKGDSADEDQALIQEILDQWTA
ncbi:MAG: biotin synthase BioB [Planctomycetes bacterium]|nr:biotin synthase BioB [Planctomycetota bacterium]